VGGRRSASGWDAGEMRQVFSLVAGMTGAILMGALTAQMDKIVLSRMLGIEQFGYYAIASSVAMGVLQLIYPVVQAALPRVVQLREEPFALRRFNFKVAGLIALITFLATIIFLLGGRQLLEIWLRNSSAASVIYPPLAILLVGTGLNALYNIGYINWLAKGRTKRVLQVNGIALVFSVSLLPAFVGWQGLPGAAIGWLTINGIGLLLSLEWLKLERMNAKCSEKTLLAD
jgi:O-antigen/teichoic acid export membrane protein